MLYTTAGAGENAMYVEAGSEPRWDVETGEARTKIRPKEIRQKGTTRPMTKCDMLNIPDDSEQEEFL